MSKTDDKYQSTIDNIIEGAELECYQYYMVLFNKLFAGDTQTIPFNYCDNFERQLGSNRR